MSEHTPGHAPLWTIQYHEGEGLWVHDEQGEKMAFVRGPAERTRLIASAPALLDLVRRLVHPMATEEDVDDALTLLAELDA